MIENKFKTVCQNFSKDTELISQLWQEIKTAHSQPPRQYHTLTHLEHIYRELKALDLTPHLEFAIFYHDIVYDVKQSDNEEQSALLAKKRLAQLNVPNEENDKVFQLIIETKTHKASSEENKLFLDADLSILGSHEKTYRHYAQNVRKEYAFYDDVTYAKGRKKVLKMFLSKERIYESKHFYDKHEKQARVNILIEYNSFTKNLK